MGGCARAGKPELRECVCCVLGLRGCARAGKPELRECGCCVLGLGGVLGLESPSYGKESVAEDWRSTKGRAVGFPVALPGGVVLSILCGGSE